MLKPNLRYEAWTVCFIPVQQVSSLAMVFVVNRKHPTPRDKPRHPHLHIMQRMLCELNCLAANTLHCDRSRCTKSGLLSDLKDATTRNGSEIAIKNVPEDVLPTGERQYNDLPVPVGCTTSA